MFSGIVAAVGKIASARAAPGGLRLRVDGGGLDFADVALGDSIAVNGACLTVVTRDAAGFEADVSHETIACTAGFAEGSRVNLEKAMRLSDRLGGHLVSGHVDGVGTVARVADSGDNRLFAVIAPAELAKYIARKPRIAKTLDVKTTKGSRVTASTAGIESTAKIRSVVSIATSTTHSGVAIH